jgi:hypothetical protein
MSTEHGDVKDALHPEFSIEVADTNGRIRLFSSVNKIFLDEAGANHLLDLLYKTYLYLGWEWVYE